ncbi:MAG: porphobilinogen synthase [Rickettsiales bacterium]
MRQTPLDLPIRPRRLRQAPWVRALVAEHQLRAEDLIWPLFVQEGAGLATPIHGLPGVERLSIDRAVEAAREAVGLGIPAIALFPVTPAELKTDDGREALNPENLLCRAIRAVKAAVPEIGIIADVALDPYTTHGHDGLLGESGDVENDATVAILCQQACVLALAGANMVAPSDMMDGRVGEIRAALDTTGHSHTVILSYAVKYASAFYGPFRAAVGSDKNLGKADKRTYQMNPANTREALREAMLDVAEGADMLMVKPAGLYLDIIARVREVSDVPLFAYQVSGEYAMLKAAAAAGMLDEQAAIMESLLAIKRAGADAIFTYAARDVAQWLAATRRAS